MVTTNNEADREAEEKIAQALNLQSLELNLSGLTQLPESIGKLTQLRKLSLRESHLKDLPEELGQLTKLRDLNVSENELTMLPEWIERLGQLQVLNLFKNSLPSLPKGHYSRGASVGDAVDEREASGGHPRTVVGVLMARRRFCQTGKAPPQRRFRSKDESCTRSRRVPPTKLHARLSVGAIANNSPITSWCL
jgi:Leucine-rich repeat (LRR) protein